MGPTNPYRNASIGFLVAALVLGYCSVVYKSTIVTLWKQPYSVATMNLQQPLVALGLLCFVLAFVFGTRSKVRN